MEERMFLTNFSAQVLYLHCKALGFSVWCVSDVRGGLAMHAELSQRRTMAKLALSDLIPV
jgi:hypothetical protein